MSLSGWSEQLPKQPHLGSSPAFSVFLPSLWPRDAAAPARPHGEAQSLACPMFPSVSSPRVSTWPLSSPSSGISPLLAPSFAHVYIFCLWPGFKKKKKKKKKRTCSSGLWAEKHLFLTQEDRIPPPASMWGISELGLSWRSSREASGTCLVLPPLWEPGHSSVAAQLGPSSRPLPGREDPPSPPSMQPKARGMNTSLSGSSFCPFMSRLYSLHLSGPDFSTCAERC